MADLGHDVYAGTGQRLLTTDRGDHALMDIRSLTLDTGASGESGDG